MLSTMTNSKVGHKMGKKKPYILYNVGHNLHKKETTHYETMTKPGVGHKKETTLLSIGHKKEKLHY